MIGEWILSKQHAWSPTTLRVTESQLRKYAPFMKSPETLWTALGALAPYSRIMTYQRCAEYAAFTNDTRFKEWRKRNGRLFRHTYISKVVPLTYSEAKVAIHSLEDPEAKARALQILLSGQRWCEAAQVPIEGIIVGKGGKRRDALAPHAPYTKSYDTFRRTLKKIGLCPHDLRKLAITHADSNGASLADLCAIAGWSSFATAIRYVQPKRLDTLKGFLK